MLWKVALETILVGTAIYSEITRLRQLCGKPEACYAVHRGCGIGCGCWKCSNL